MNQHLHHGGIGGGYRTTARGTCDRCTRGGGVSYDRSTDMGRIGTASGGTRHTARTLITGNMSIVGTARVGSTKTSVRGDRRGCHNIGGRAGGPKPTEHAHHTSLTICNDCSVQGHDTDGTGRRERRSEWHNTKSMYAGSPDGIGT